MPVVGAGWPLLDRAKMPVVGVGTCWPLLVGVEAGWPPLEREKMPVVGVVEAGWLLDRAKMPVVGVEG